MKKRKVKKPEKQPCPECGPGVGHNAPEHTKAPERKPFRVGNPDLSQLYGIIPDEELNRPLREVLAERDCAVEPAAQGWVVRFADGSRLGPTFKTCEAAEAARREFLAECQRRGGRCCVLDDGGADRDNVGCMPLDPPVQGEPDKACADLSHPLTIFILDGVRCACGKRFESDIDRAHRRSSLRWWRENHAPSSTHDATCVWCSGPALPPIFWGIEQEMTPEERQKWPPPAEGKEPTKEDQR